MTRTRRRASLLAATAAVLLIAAPAVAATHAGDLDPSFNGTGAQTLNPRGLSGSAWKVLVQPDGKILLAGDSGNDMAVTRLNADGSVDQGFGLAGTAAVSFDPNLNDDVTYESEGIAIALQGEKIVVAGREWHGGANGTRVAVARLTANGTLDTSFGQGYTPGNGRILYDFGAGSSNSATDVAVLPDSKILVSGFGGSRHMFVVTRLKPGGVPDGTFAGGSNSTAVVDFGSDTQAESHTMSIAPGGGIVLAGRVTTLREDAQADFGVGRLTAEGLPETGFGADGKRRFGNTTQFDFAADSAIDADGNIVLAGTAPDGTPADAMAVTRLGPGGAFVPLGGKDVVTIQAGAQSSSGATLGIQPDGKIVVGGAYSNAGSDLRPVVARLSSDGALDAGFGAGGLARFDYQPGPGGIIQTLALQPDGRIVVGGFAFVNAKPSQLAAARLFGASTTDGDPGDPSQPTTVLSGLKLKPTKFPAAGSGPSITASATKKKPRKTGTTVTYSDAQNATSTFTVLRALKGRSVGGKCVKATRANRKNKACTLLKKVGSFESVDVAGPNRLHFTGRVKNRKLAPGSYRLQVTATGANGVPSAPVVKAFTIVR